MGYNKTCSEFWSENNIMVVNNGTTNFGNKLLFLYNLCHVSLMKITNSLFGWNVSLPKELRIRVKTHDVHNFVTCGLHMLWLTLFIQGEWDGWGKQQARDSTDLPPTTLCDKHRGKSRFARLSLCGRKASQLILENYGEGLDSPYALTGKDGHARESLTS
jgi:hypothetical protein